MKTHVRVDVVIVGAGVAGLFLAMKLAELGFKVILIERKGEIAAGPSTRNEGWLHPGTYHATSIKDRVRAIQVARRCKYGHDQIKRFAPEALEDLDLPAFALVKDPHKVAEFMSRWNEAGVQHHLVSRHDFRRIEPLVNTSDVAAIFAVADVSLNTRLLYSKVLAQAKRSGAQVITKATLTRVQGEKAVLYIEGRAPVGLTASLFVYTSGFGLRGLFQEQFSIELPLRYWKSHLLILPRITKHGVFCVDAGEAAMMHHGNHSIIGLNEDAQIVDKPDYEVVPANAARVHCALQRMMKKPLPGDCLKLACIKVDMRSSEFGDRSLNVSFGEPQPNHLWVLPGKMTEAPFVTDVVAHIIFERLKGCGEPVAFRPCDQLGSNESNGVSSRRKVRRTELALAK